MTHVHGSIEIDRPVDVVFDVVADQTQEPTYNPQMVSAERVTPGPLGRGTQFHAVTRSGRREVPVEVEVLDYERPRRLHSLTTSPEVVVDGTIDFTPSGTGTRMTWDWDVQPLGWLGTFSPLVGYLGRRQEERIWAGLKRYLEDGG